MFLFTSSIFFKRIQITSSLIRLKLLKCFKKLNLQVSKLSQQIGLFTKYFIKAVIISEC